LATVEVGTYVSFQPLPKLEIVGKVSTREGRFKRRQVFAWRENSPTPLGLATFERRD